jgi:UDP-GlcNAc:undecaprenyl-phosphate GlcNAc-1-phosphate transferase
MKDYLYILIIAAVVTYLLTPLVRLGAGAAKAQHEPRDRDVHVKPTPLLGGIAMYGGLAAGLLVADRLTYLQQAFPSSRTIEGLLLAGGLLVLIGAVDDRWGLGVIARLAGQIAAAGIIVWSGASLPWIPWPGSGTITLEPDLSYTLTILIIVATINAVNFIDGLDGLAAGVVAISALAYMVYSYVLTNSVGIPSESVPAVASAVLAGVCIGFLPHNFHPARIFMGDAGAYLLGLLLAYGPIQSTATLDYNILVNYSHGNPINRFPEILPLILPIAIWIIPYTDMLLAVFRRTWAGKSPFAADGQHLHHRLLNMGHSHRQSVLLMYLWAALFSGLVVGLSVLRLSLIWFALATLAAMAALLLATAPKLRPWHTARPGKRRRKRGTPVRSESQWTAATAVAAPGGGRRPGSHPIVRPARNAAPLAPPVPPVTPNHVTHAPVSAPVSTGPVAQGPLPPAPVKPPLSPPPLSSRPVPPPVPLAGPPWSSRPGQPPNWPPD